ncbi:MAG: putative blue pigment (indigoidine) exporter [Oleispira sp.]|jgi:probable blue pigment (indigoidine) exporter
MSNSSRLPVILLIMLTAIAPTLWGTTYIVTTELLPVDRPFIAAFLRLLPAGIILVLISRHLPKRDEWLRIVILATLNFAFFHVLLFVSAYRLPGGLAAVVSAIQPLMMMFLIWFVDNRKPASLALVASIVGVFGVAVLLLSPSSTWDFIGILASTVGAMLMTCGVFLARRWRTDMPLLAFTGWQLLIAGIMLAPFAWFIDPPLLTLTTKNMLGYGYLALFGTTFAYVLWFNGIAKLSTVAVSSLGLLSPISAVILGWIVLDQSITGFALMGLIAVLGSILTVQWALAPKKIPNPMR